MMVLKNTVRTNRKEQRISQVQLAKSVGTTRETIGRIETGEMQSVSYRLVYDLASFFGKPAEELFYYEEEQ